MELEQLSVLDLPPVNPLGLLPLYSLSGKDAEAIAQFAELMADLRLDQLPDDLAGNGTNPDHLQPHLPITIDLSAIAESQKAVIDATFLEKTNDLETFPEKPKKVITHGYVEPYEVFGANKKVYSYTRYVYMDERKKLKHHHIPDKQAEAIAAMWRDGASCKELCTALGKTCGLE